ncbi:fluoride efflux transporter CrcB [Pseudochelatococcus sp. B33]
MSAAYALTVFAGAGLGGVLRWLVGIVAARWLGTSFPWGTMFVNVSGSFVMGGLAALLLFRAGAAEWQGARLFLLTGVLGGYTTFSSYALDIAVLWEQGDFSAAAIYGLGSVVLSVAGLAAGLALVRSLA